ncbi:MAG TPA: WYL domain-containing protein [Longimicrobiales bacterium]|nr:WYL domain-containing protein [Longimicrobiales bacterium]
MTIPPTKLQRWLDIIAYLVTRRLPTSADELLSSIPAYAGRWQHGTVTEQESVRRSFERDKDELRALGIPIRTVKYSTADRADVQEGYVIERREFYLPYLKLVAEPGGGQPYRDRARPDSVEIADADAPLALEALARVSNVPGFPLAREARSAFRKLAFDLEPEAAPSHSAVLFMDPPGTTELAGHLRTISDALLARKRIRFTYNGIHRGETTARDVATFGLLFQHGHWYLIGHDALRDAVRIFRVGRMSDVVANTKSPNRADYEVPPDFRLDEFAGREPWELGGEEEAPVVARVRFRFPLSLWAERNRHGTLEVRGTDGDAVRRFDVQQVDPFLRWLLSLEGEAEVLEPESLKHELRAVAQEIARAHSEGTH